MVSSLGCSSQRKFIGFRSSRSSHKARKSLARLVASLLSEYTRSIREKAQIELNTTQRGAGSALSEVASPSPLPFTSSTTSSSLRLPPPTNVSHVEITKNIENLFPELAGLDDQTVRDILLPAMAPEMNRVMKATQIGVPTSSKPNGALDQINIILPPFESSAHSLPTFVTSVCRSCNSSNPPEPVLLTHELVLAAHCGELYWQRRKAEPASPVTATESSVCSVPVIEIANVPVPGAYRDLHEYLHTKDESALAEKLTNRKFIVSSYLNALYLGIVDQKLYEILSVAFDNAVE